MEKPPECHNLSPDDPVAAGLAALAEFEAGEVWRKSDGELTSLLRAAAVLRAQADAVLVAAAGEAAARGSYVPSAPSAATWVGQVARVDRREATELLRVAEAVRSDCAETGRGMARGTVSLAHARIITTAMDALPAHTSDSARADAEALLVDSSGILRTCDLRAVAQAVHEKIAAQAPDIDDPDEAAALAAEEARAEERRVNQRGLWMRPGRDGMWNGRFTVTPDAAETILAALEPLARPTHEAPTDDAPVQPLARDERNRPQRMADALHELCLQALNSGALAQEGGERPHVTMTVSYETLQNLLRQAGTLDIGGVLSPAEARRLLCDCKVVPVVLGGRSEPLDVGRAARTFPLSMRRAVVARDRGCVRPGCHRSVRTTQVHHIVHWVDGGGTSVSNGCLLCDVHHRQVHLQGWDIRIAANGFPELIPPASLDPLRRPVQHERFHLNDLAGDPCHPR